ncbi:helix-turn-helix transcriptional regulator [Bdellovibrio svalbardensis]|uniref:LuxR C-terminal-related transcriptional regulator n=1 Tax=Bdellovibrio svalbardensis TaxID=2972972 RepID=A0ABT6DHR2_9BACT|nr:LuxR C-terminal-related transcriptional regulator [Bdellovibrio svalbardensis]MDG0816397.1 LuxR C-terminal-related transcriptional regulator [Bdellovibrio svalbardensis]
MEELSKVGVCIKDQEQRVLYQNNLSLQICGEQSGQICGKVCKKLYGEMKECSAISQGMKLFKSTEIDGSKVDAVIVNDGERISTFFYPLNEEQDQALKQEAYFAERGLTKSEIRIMQMVMQGMINSEIAEKLFISKATLKTHLNNAYKKLPPSMRPSQLRSLEAGSKTSVR